MPLVGINRAACQASSAFGVSLGCAMFPSHNRALAGIGKSGTEAPWPVTVAPGQPTSLLKPSRLGRVMT